MKTLRAAHPVVVIGAGIGGLATAIRLRAAGQRVLLLERAAAPGGKMRQVRVGEHLFDAGPTVLTMRHVFEDLFAAAGQRLSDWVPLERLDPLCRHFFADGLVLDLYSDELGAAQPWARSAEAVRAALGQRAADEFCAYRRYAAQIYDAARVNFIESALPRTPLGLLRPGRAGKLLHLLHIDALRTMWRALEGRFHDPHLRVLFGRYATYCGSDPFRAPATLNVIPHVELGLGVWSVAGGMHRLAQALDELARQLGVDLRYGADVESIELDAHGRRVAAVRAGGERVAAAAVVANCDVAQLSARLLSGTRVGAALDRRARRLEPSLSACLNLVVTRPTDPSTAAPAGPALCHHNVFFSADYRREFTDLLAGRPPHEPTVYLCNPDHDRPAQAQRWYFLTNAPALPARAETEATGAEAARGETEATGLDWEAEAPRCRARLSQVLLRAGVDLDARCAAERMVTPPEFAGLFPHSRGALYGSASNGRMSAFLRPRNVVSAVGGLYCVGGSAHPGAGVPMVAQSARIAAELLLREACGA